LGKGGPTDPGRLTCDFGARRQLYSTYAVHLTTLSPPALVGDALLVLFLWRGTGDSPDREARIALQALLAWMVFSKFVKLLTHFVRHPVDILLWPVSVLFGWFHGGIKFYALATLNEVSHPLTSPPPVWRQWTAYGMLPDDLGQPRGRRCQ